jgi:hypothetical protein
MSDETIRQYQIGKGRTRPPYLPRSIVCSNCTAPVSLYSERSQLVVCDSCGSQLDLTTEELQILGKVKKESSLTLDLGTQFVWEDVRYKIIGRLILKDNWGDNSFDYLLFHPFRGTRWLSEYEGSFTLNEVSHVMPKSDPFVCKEGVSIKTHDGKDWRCTEEGVLKIIYVDGALPWIAKTGDTHKYVEFANSKDRKLIFEAEQSLSYTSEMEFGVSRKLSKAEMNTALGRKLRVASTSGSSVSTVPPIWRTITKVMAVCTFIFFLLKIFSSSSEMVGDIGFEANDLNQEMVSKSFSITTIDKPIRLDCMAAIDNGWMALNMAIVEVPEPISERETYMELLQRESDLAAEKRSKVVHIINTDISYYHGYEGGESWSEGSTYNELLVMFPKAGEYRIMASAVSNSGNTESADKASHSLYIRVFQNVELIRYYVLMVFLSIFVFFHVRNL